MMSFLHRKVHEGFTDVKSFEVVRLRASISLFGGNMRRYIDRVIEAENSTITVDSIECNITVDRELSTHTKVFIHGSKAVNLLKVTLNRNTDITNQVVKEVREFFRNIKSSIIDPTDYIIKHN